MNLAFLRSTLVTGVILFSSASIVLSQNILLVSESRPPYPVSLGDVWAEGDIACVGVYSPHTSGYGVGIFDISNPISPVYLTNYYTSPIGRNQFEHGAVRNKIGYFASNSGGGVHIVSLTNAASPVLLAKIGAITGTTTNGHDNVHTMFLYRDFLYEADNQTPVVKVFDVSDPHLPVFVRDIVPVDAVQVHQITVVNNRLYTSCIRSAPGKTDIWDVEHIGTQDPIHLGTVYTGSSAHSSRPTADNKILAICRETTGGELSIWSITNPAVPVLLSSILPASMGLQNNLPHNPVIVSNLLFVSWYQNGVQVFNIENPAKPVRVGSMDTRFPAPSGPFSYYEGNWGVFPDLGLNKVLLSDMQRGLMILDASAVLTATNSFPPLLIQSPSSLTVTSGFSATFTGEFSGSSLKYQWQRNGTNVPGATSSTYAIPNVHPGNSGMYRLRSTNFYGVVTSAVATLSVTVADPLAPVISAHPASVSVYPESSVTFSVAATGAGPISYQWRLNEGNIPNATGIDYVRTNIQPEDTGYYSVIVSNQYGVAVSSNALLTLIDSPYINSVSMASGLRSASIKWKTTIPSNGRVYFEAEQTGASGAAMRAGISGSFSNASYVDSSVSTNHNITLSGLEPSTTYYLQIVSSDGTNDFLSKVYSFKTGGDIIMDNGSASFSGTWITGASADAYGIDYLFASTGSSFTYRPQIVTRGYYNVYAWFPQRSDASTNARYSISYSGGSTNVTISQRANWGTWILLAGNLPFVSGTSGSVGLSTITGSGATMADAVKFEYVASQDEPNGVTAPIWWQVFYYGTLMDVTGDFDRDGYTDAKEYVIGTSPVDRKSLLNVTIENEGSTNATITFFPLLPDRSYELLRKTEAGGPSWQSVFSGFPPENEHGQGHLNAIAGGNDQGYFRLRVQNATVGGFSASAVAKKAVKYSFTNEVVCGGPNRVFRR